GTAFAGALLLASTDQTFPVLPSRTTAQATYPPISTALGSCIQETRQATAAASMAFPPASIACAAARAQGSGSHAIAARRPSTATGVAAAVPRRMDKTPREDLTKVRRFIPPQFLRKYDSRPCHCRSTLHGKENFVKQKERKSRREMWQAAGMALFGASAMQAQ